MDSTIAASLATAVFVAAVAFRLKQPRAKAKLAASALDFRKGPSATTTYLPSPFSLTSIPSLKGKTAIVTGGNTGIGYQIVKNLALNGAKVFLAARSKERADKAISQLEKEAKKANRSISVEFVRVDLADLKQTKEAAIKLAQRIDRIDILVNNAGVMDILAKDSFSLSKDGWENMFATNHLGHFMFTKQLLPVLLHSPGIPRIIVLSSSATWRAPLCGIDFDSLKEKRCDFVPFHYYGQSKLANLLFSNRLHELHGSQIIVNAVHPGAVASDLLRPPRFSILWLLTSWIPKSFFTLLSMGKLLSVEKGAYSALFAATTTQTDIRGKYIIPFGAVSKDYHPKGSDTALAKQLWDLSEAACEECLRN
ncbi:hypothetical protein BDR26DRAFT_822388 [Obelidium mucronatum]|nr:hypothetical protein BDR26DRAFT_822388 [Obelidium mucronatum]